MLAVCLGAAGSTSAAAKAPPYQSLIEHWDGAAWTQVPSPVTGDSVLYEVAAASADAVWAFGLRGKRTPLALHWQGSAWHRVAIPAPKGSDEVYLITAAVESASDIWLVGYWGGPKHRGSRTLIEHWNGKAWRIVPSPSPSGISSGFLYGVTALSPRNAWAVGRVEVGSRARTLILHWNGKAWKRVPSPNPTDGGTRHQHYLSSVAAVSARNVWAVGSYFHRGANGRQSFVTLVLHWNGKAWKRVASPNPGGLGHFHVLWDVASDPAGGVWAVGEYRDGSGNGFPLAERWTGAGPWQVLPAPGPAHPRQQLESVSPLATDDVWAAGTSFDEAGEQALVQHWDGNAWNVVPTPELGVDHLFTAIAAVSTSDVWAVGSVINP